MIWNFIVWYCLGVSCYFILSLEVMFALDMEMKYRDVAWAFFWGLFGYIWCVLLIAFSVFMIFYYITKIIINSKFYNSDLWDKPIFKKKEN